MGSAARVASICGGGGAGGGVGGGGGGGGAGGGGGGGGAPRQVGVTWEGRRATGPAGPLAPRARPRLPQQGAAARRRARSGSV
jgi:hypothetical protein